MKRKKTNFFMILFLLLSTLAITVVVKALFDPHGIESPTQADPVPVTIIPEDNAGVVAIIQAIEELTTADSLPSELDELTLQQEEPSCSYNPEAAESIESKETSTEESPAETIIAPTSTENTLFIGDSRTVGLSEYAQMGDAHFFAAVGMTVYSVDTANVSVPHVGKVTLSELLQKHSYDKIYIMLGINELGYPIEKTLEKYRALIQSIQEAQPNTLIFVQANLHITKSRSDNDKVINNPKIDTFNDHISQLADNERVFYLDANCIFDDADGALSEAKSVDHAHPMAKYYQEWGNWIAEQTGAILS